MAASGPGESGELEAKGRATAIAPARMPKVRDESAYGELRVQLHLTQAEADALLGLAHDLCVKLPRTS